MYSHEIIIMYLLAARKYKPRFDDAFYSYSNILYGWLMGTQFWIDSYLYNGLVIYTFLHWKWNVLVCVAWQDYIDNTYVFDMFCTATKIPNNTEVVCMYKENMSLSIY